MSDTFSLPHPGREETATAFLPSPTYQKICGAARLLAMFGVLAFFALGPALSALAPRALGIALPILGAFTFPFFALTFRRRIKPAEWLGGGVVLALLVFGLWQTPVQDRVPSLVRAIVGEGAGAFCGLYTILKMERAFLQRLLGVVCFSVALTAGLVLVEWLFDMPINRALRHFDGGVMPPLYALDRTIIQVALLLWPIFGFARIKGVSNWILLPGMVLVEAVVLQGSSQASAVALGAGLLVYLLVSWQPSWSLRLGRLGLTVLLILAPFLIPLLNHLLGLKPDLWYQASAGERLRIWSLTVIEILDRPWLGHGIEAAREFGNWGRVRGHPHNGILQVWAEFGLVGILLFAAGLRGLLQRVGKSPLILQPVLLAGFVAWLVVFCVGYSNWQSWWMATAAVLVMVFAAVERLCRSSVSVLASGPVSAPVLR